MKVQLITELSALAGISVLLVAGIATGTASRLPGPIETPALVETIETIEGDAVGAAEEAVDPQRKHRRARASLSMPYFSFAQLLRPRG